MKKRVLTKAKSLLAILLVFSLVFLCISKNYAQETVKVNVKADCRHPARTVIEASGFKIIIDEPEPYGGTNLAANPVEYLLAAFAGCLNVICHLVAQEMGFELKNLEIEIEGDLNPSKAMGTSMAERAGYKEIRIKFKPYTDADKETLKKWVEAVTDRCCVHDSISNATPVKISLE